MAYDQKLADADRMLNDAGARLYVLEAENERLRAAASDMLAELKWIAEKHGYQSTVDIIAKAEGAQTH